MGLVILGASVRTGQQVTRQALIRGHSVTAVLRHIPSAEKSRLRIVTADPCKSEEFAAAMSGTDAVISCLGHRTGGNPWLVRDAATSTLQAMQKKTGTLPV